MPDVRPFRPYRYPVEVGGDLSSRIAPPYDVLDEGPKRALLERDRNNIVEIDLPVTPPKTVGPDEAYMRAGRTLQTWIDTGVLARDAQPAMFAYEQRWSRGDSRVLRRRGLFAAVGVEELGRPGGGIHRHEETIRAGTDDRLKLMEATASQLSPVFSVYDDANGSVGSILEPIYEREPGFVGRTDGDGVDHRVWAVEDPSVFASIGAAFSDRDVFIADGHHRYVTALNYSRDHGGVAEASACLMVLVARQDPGMIVLPAHRVLTGFSGLSPERLVEALASGPFELRSTNHGADGLGALAAALPGAGPHAVGLFDPVSGQTWTMSTRHEDPGRSEWPERPEAWRTLDVVVLHELFVDGILRPVFGGEGVGYKYPHRIEDLIELCRENGGAGRLGVLMQATPLASVIRVSLAGDVMPPKSTFFFPKVASGLVINPLVS
jgi:uncharacterized protein (DUF1015 family)